MSDQLEGRLRRLVQELAEVAPPPHSWPLVVATAPRAVMRRRSSWVVAAATVAVFAAAVVAVVAIRSEPAGLTTVDGPRPSGVVSQPSPSDSESVTATVPEATDALSPSTPPAAGSASAIGPLCSKGAHEIVRTLLERRVAGDDSRECLDLVVVERFTAGGPLCWSTCDDGSRVVGFELQDAAVRWENSIDAMSGWAIGAAIDLVASDGQVVRSIEQWELTDNPDGSLWITAVDAVPTDEVETIAVDTVARYLEALATGRYDEAAELLGRGGQDWDERVDLGALPDLPSDVDGLANALRAWCNTDALCSMPREIGARPLLGGAAAEVFATFEIEGRDATATFTAYLDEGTPGVTGLPPLAGPASLSVLSEVIGASAVVARLPGGSVVAWNDGQLSELPAAVDANVWSDGSFVYWQTNGNDPAASVTTRSTAATVDGTVVCDLEGRIRDVRQRADGYVATVERPDQTPGTPDEVAVPTYAVDCSSGVETPIESTSWLFEGGYRSIVRIGDRTFTVRGDSEGNADVTNETGISISGDDYAGNHTYSPDGSQVVYGDYSGSPSPLLTNVIRSRDTTTGELLWSADLARPFSYIHHLGDRIIVQQPPDRSLQDPSAEVEYLIIHDARTGQQLGKLPTILRVVWAN